MSLELHTSAPGFTVLRSNEGKALKAYKDIVGIWTIGFGQTNADGKYLGINIKAGLVITEAQAEQLLQRAVTERYEPAVRKAMGPDARQQDFDAGIDFHYNTGAITRASWVKSFVAKNIPAIHSQLMSWNKASGKTLAALTRRRNRDWEMINTGNYGPEGHGYHAGIGAVPSSVVPPGATTKAPEPAVVSPIATPGMLALNDSGPEVTDLQHTLIEVGYKDVGTEGVFGPVTASAVADFQKRHPQLRSDGKVGPATRAALQRDLDAKVSLAGTVKKGLGGGGITASVDQLAGGHLPWFVYAGIALLVVGGLAFTAWKYRDEIRGMLLTSEKNT